MKTTLSFPYDLLTEVKHEAVRQHRKLNDLVPELVRLGLGVQRQVPVGMQCRETAEAWLTEWQSPGSRIVAKTEGVLKIADYISVDPNVCHGKACIRGTRVMVSVILDNLAAGASADEIRRAYPSVSDGAICAAITYAAELSHERVLAVPA